MSSISRVIILALALCVQGAAAFSAFVSPAASTYKPSVAVRGSLPLEPRRACIVTASTEDEQSSPAVAAAAAAGLVANPVMWVSLYFVATTGGGLPAGPFGLIGALEGVSYLVVVGFVGAALYKKATTGSGLPAGPGGLLGASEGLSFLSIVAGVVVLALLVGQENCVPNALPLADYSDKVAVCK